MKKIVIVGASSGIGRRVADDFARKGYKVGVCARREDKLRELAAEHPGRIVYRALDVTSPDAGSQLLGLVADLGGMDVILIASGVGFANPDLAPGLDERIMAVNVGGFTRVVNTAYKYYKESGSKGHIVGITSVAGTKGMGLAPTYSATKSYQQAYLQAIDQLSRMQDAGVAVTDIRPGFIRTPLLDPKKCYPLIMALDYAAPLIEKAIERAPRVACIDWRWGLVTGLWRLIPNFVWPRLMSLS